MSLTIDGEQQRRSWYHRECAVCYSPAIGINFGALTCAPCKAFFRRNARRKEILFWRCRHCKIDLSQVTNNEQYDLIIRRCTACRLRRCFQMGMKEDLVRTDEENIRHRQLVDMNRQRKQSLVERQKQKQSIIPQCTTINKQILEESDWCHLSNIVSAYETYCLKLYIEQRSIICTNETEISSSKYSSTKHHVTMPMSLTCSLYSFLRALPAFQSLSLVSRKYLCKQNLRSLLFPSMMELKQTCFAESWQTSLEESTWEYICGSELYHRFIRTQRLAQRLLIADPTVTRVWLVVLFFSSSLAFVYSNTLSDRSPKKKTTIIGIQNAYVTLLWTYLLHRYGELVAIQMYSNLIRVYLKMQEVGAQIDFQIRTRNDLNITNQAIDQVLLCDN